jgi:hypothetical protein
MLTDKTDFDYLPFLPPELRPIPWRLHPLDGKLLLFERDHGLNLLMEGDETAHLRRIAPRTLLIAVTNACNLTCAFCYRDLQNRSLWRYETLLEFCQQADEWGVLEVAFGGGDPTLFPRWDEFINELYATTRLAINFTTNGILLTDEFLQQTHGKYGQIRLSLYDDNDWRNTIKKLVSNNARFGINWLITPEVLPKIETQFIELLALGVRDFLLLTYKGEDAALHLRGDSLAAFGAFVNKAYQQLGNQITLKLDKCLGDALPEVPRLFTHEDCGAADEFLSITSDKHVKGCSFMATSTGIPFETLADVRHIWETRRAIKTPAYTGGCARLPERGLATTGGSHAVIPLDAIQ